MGQECKDGEAPVSAEGLLAFVAERLAPHGLLLRGGTTIEATRCGDPVRTVLLIGQAGCAMWPFFQAWLAAQKAVPDHPLDTWSREILDPIAAEIGACAVSPSDRPFWPFQQWAMKAEGLKPSPLGVLMHPHYGLWHAYRGALLVDSDILIPEPREENHLCDACVGKPCLSACPVGAYSLEGFAQEKCRSWLTSAGETACMDAGCLARNACPYAGEYRYGVEQQRFHMRSFART